MLINNYLRLFYFCFLIEHCALFRNSLIKFTVNYFTKKIQNFDIIKYIDMLYNIFDFLFSGIRSVNIANKLLTN